VVGFMPPPVKLPDADAGVGPEPLPAILPGVGAGTQASGHVTLA